MEEDQELKFVCKLCNKKFLCGKSLGGHVRSHVVANSAESDEKLIEANMKKNSSSLGGEYGNGQTSYGLRENPRKTWRAAGSSFPLPLERFCKQCGKGFQSLKALCGHMACHSEKDKGLKDDHSWSSSENQKLVFDSHSDTEPEDRVFRTRSSKSKKYKKLVVKSPLTLANNNNNGSSSVSEIDGEEQEDVAMCLMLLSRDLGNKGGVNSVVESSDNNSVILETKSSSIDMRIGKTEVFRNVDGQNDVGKKVEDVTVKDYGLDAEIAQTENSDSGYFLDECAKAESDVSVDGFRRNYTFSPYDKFGDEYRQSLMNKHKKYIAEVKKELAKEFECDNDAMPSNSARIESRKRKFSSENQESCNEYGLVRRFDSQSRDVSEKRIKYECFNCKRTFKSYQALGGHRPCHKRTNAYYESRYECGENSLDDSTEFVTRGKNIKSSAMNSSAEKKIKAKKNKGHVCPFCDRVFKNGQALGGHKRSHFIGGHDENIKRSPEKKPDLLDLNLPAPEEDEEDVYDKFLADF